MTSESLKPCPFCGGQSEFERKGDSRKSTIVSCQDCGASLENGEEWDHGRGWNTRADLQHPAVSREEIADKEKLKKMAWNTIFGENVIKTPQRAAIISRSIEYADAVLSLTPAPVAETHITRKEIEPLLEQLDEAIQTRRDGNDAYQRWPLDLLLSCRAYLHRAVSGEQPATEHTDAAMSALIDQPEGGE